MFLGVKFHYNLRALYQPFLFGRCLNRSWQQGDPIVEPQGVYRLPNGKLVLSRECP